MIKKIHILLLTAVLFLIPQPSQAANVYCFCADRIEGVTAENYEKEETRDKFKSSSCRSIPKDDCSKTSSKNERISGGRYAYCEAYESEQECRDKGLAVWQREYDNAFTTAGQAAGGLTRKGSRLIPDCALQDDLDPGSPCRDVSIFLVVAIEIARYLFTIIGGVAVLMFIYGGFMLIISGGNSEKLTKAKEILLAVVLGLLVAFAGYLLVAFLGQSLGISKEFQLFL